MSSKKIIYLFFVFASFTNCKDFDLSNQSFKNKALSNSYNDFQENKYEARVVKYLYAPGRKKFVGFSFLENKEVSKTSEDWDIAFSAQTIALNHPIAGSRKNKMDINFFPSSFQRIGKVKVAVLDKEVNFLTNEKLEQLSSQFESDKYNNYAIVNGPSRNSSFFEQKGWYKWYKTPSNKKFKFTPIENRCFIFKIYNKKTKTYEYVKMKILNYYKNVFKSIYNRNIKVNEAKYYTFEYQFLPAYKEFDNQLGKAFSLREEADSLRSKKEDPFSFLQENTKATESYHLAVKALVEFSEKENPKTTEINELNTLINKALSNASVYKEVVK